jgi:solute carrier family 35 protein F1/2
MGFDLKEIRTKKTLIGLGLGQLLSLLATSNGFTSSELARKGFKFLLFWFITITPAAS